MTPVIIIGGILSGLFTPTEAAVVATLYALFLGFLYKDLTLRATARDLLELHPADDQPALHHLPRRASSAGSSSTRRIPDQIIVNSDRHERHANGIIAMIILVVLILGCFLEGNAIFIITIPIFLPIAQRFGIDLINFGVVMTLLIMIGNLTPPVGMCLFAVSSFCKVSVGDPVEGGLAVPGRGSRP